MRIIAMEEWLILVSGHYIGEEWRCSAGRTVSGFTILEEGNAGSICRPAPSPPSRKRGSADL